VDDCTLADAEIQELLKGWRSPPDRSRRVDGLIRPGPPPQLGEGLSTSN